MIVRKKIEISCQYAYNDVKRPEKWFGKKWSVCVCVRVCMEKVEKINHL